MWRDIEYMLAFSDSQYARGHKNTKYDNHLAINVSLCETKGDYFVESTKNLARRRRFDVTCGHHDYLLEAFDLYFSCGNLSRYDGKFNIKRNNI